MADTLVDILENFSLLDDWEERYRYVIDLGRDLGSYPDEARDETHKVRGCVSQVWLLTHQNDDADPTMTFQGASDAHIVSGLVYLVLAFYSGKKASEIIRADIEGLLKQLGLDENLTPQRSNGLRSMVKRIQEDAQKALDKSET